MFSPLSRPLLNHVYHTARHKYPNEVAAPLYYHSSSIAVAEEPKKIDHCESWYYHDIDHLPEPTRELFEQYSGIPPKDVINYIQQMRSEAFIIYPYPCIGQHRFLNLSLSRHPLYPEVLSRLRAHNNSKASTYKNNPRSSSSQPSLHITGLPSTVTYPSSDRPQTFLDLGCCLGQDLRKLVHDGCSSENIYGLDVESKFIDLSYDLWQDSDTLRSRFVVADMFDHDEETSPSHLPVTTPPPPPPLLPLGALHSKIDVVAANSFFHLYPYASQLQLAQRVSRLLAPRRGSLILGRQVGSTRPGEYTAVDGKGTKFHHDVESWRELWAKVGEALGCKFRVEGELDEIELGKNKNQGVSWAEPNIRRLRFGVWRE